jgi:hypothetical protein
VQDELLGIAKWQQNKAISILATLTWKWKCDSYSGVVDIEECSNKSGKIAEVGKNSSFE